MSKEDDLTREEWNALGEQQMIALLTKAWDRPLVSLTDAVYWLSTSGVPREPDYDELMAAADVLVKALQEGNLRAFGIPTSGDVHAPIPVDSILSATANGSGFFDDLNPSALPAIMWTYDPGNDRDHILGFDGPLWSRLSVKRDDIREMWPAIVQPEVEAARALKPISVFLAMELLSEKAKERGGDILDAKAAETYLNTLGYRGRDNIREAVRNLAPGRKQGRPKNVQG